MNLTFIGGGNMAGAILEGYLAHYCDPASCYVIEIDAVRRAFLEKKYAVKTSEEVSEFFCNTAIILLAVKPQQMPEVVAKLKTFLSHKPLIISIAAGIRLEKISHCLNGYDHIVRAMPNMAALIHSGITGLTAMSSVTHEERAQAEQLMKSVGDILWFDNEKQLDAVTAVSGSGPAYVFYFIEALEEAGIALGLTKEQASALALKTFAGASQLVLKSQNSASLLRQKVTSKGGTTEAAIRYLENTAVKQHFMDAVFAAAKRAEELGK